MNDDTYLDASELAALRSEIARDGFQRDPLVAEHADRAHIGLNLAVGWPLPASLESAYDAFRARARALDPGLYVYPFPTTHITVLTAVSFKAHADPRPDTVAAVEEAAEALGDWLEAANDFPAFALEFGCPVLARAAAFIPIGNPTGEIARLRQRALAFCRQSAGILSAASIPRTIHSTVLRFADFPLDALGLTTVFDQLASSVRFGSATIDRVLVTLETKPYMRAGRVTRSVALGGSSSRPAGRERGG